MPEHTFSGIRAVILDIEGTIAPITFVKESLFPYALKKLPDYLADNWNAPDFQALLSTFPAEAQASPAALQAHVEDLTARDVKVAYLKNLQGLLWRFGYESGELVTPLYGDVAPTLEQWKQTRKLAIFSSGSVEAQKMFFGHVGSGSGDGDGAARDLKPLFEPRWFDTVNAGPKFEAKSYENILAAIEAKPLESLFLSDHIKEVQAARATGLHAALMVRPGNPPQETDEDETPVTSLEEIQLK